MFSHKYHIYAVLSILKITIVYFGWFNFILFSSIIRIMKKNKMLLQVGKNIRDARKEKELTQEDLAEKADINPKFLGKVERAETNVSLRTLSKICDALRISLCELLAFTAMDKELLRLGDLSSDIWKLIKSKDKKTIQLSIKVFKEILEGIEALSKSKT